MCKQLMIVLTIQRTDLGRATPCGYLIHTLHTGTQPRVLESSPVCTRQACALEEDIPCPLHLSLPQPPVHSTMAPLWVVTVYMRTCYEK